MRRRVGWVGCFLFAAACAAGRLEPGPAAPVRVAEPFAGGLTALAAGAPDDATRLLSEAATRYPVLDDYALYFRARAAAARGDTSAAERLGRELLTRHPDSVWAGAAALLEGRLLRGSGELAAARASLAEARAALPQGSKRWLRATLLLAETESQVGNTETSLDLARELRRAGPRSLAARRARRLVARVGRARPDLAVDHVEEAEMRLREGDPGGARDEAEIALGTELPSELRARALWVRAQAEHGLGLTAASEATCLALAAREPTDPLAARALATAAGWRWNADDDAGAQRLFHDVIRRFPASPPAADALYGLGRIAQEAGRFEEAREAYSRLAERFPHADVAAEARWRAAWIRYLAGQMAPAAEAFARLAAKSRDAPRVAAEYWRARALERLGRNDEARDRFAHIAERHPASYYAGRAEERLGRRPPEGGSVVPPAAPVFPAELGGHHAERARVLAGLGLRRFARLEVEALVPAGPRRSLLLEAYRAVGAFSAAIRLAPPARPASASLPGADLYPLGYWDEVEPVARAHGVDPLLVVALIRQESLFEPEAVSSAGARGLMQLLPSTARRMRSAEGRPAPTPAALHDVATNVELGTTLLAHLLARYDGSTVKALAAYNGGEDAVAKWERRYAGRDPDEFVELISYRETRDYVKAVLRNHRLYRLLYVAPSPSATSAGSPPKAPFDMMTTTSPARALASR